MLRHEGYRVTGVDASPEMIARAKAKDTAGQIDWRVGDVTALTLGAKFDAVVSVADVFNHLPTLDEWEAALRCFHEHLPPGGLVFVDAMTIPPPAAVVPAALPFGAAISGASANAHGRSSVPSSRASRSRSFASPRLIRERAVSSGTDVRVATSSTARPSK